MSDQTKVDRTPARIILLLSSSCVALLFFSLFLLFRSPGNSLLNPQTRQNVLAELTKSAKGGYDSHPDPDVGKTLARGLVNKELQNTVVSSNRYGMRERDYPIPKPEDTIRIVLLGDSFVYGLGVSAEKRLGLILENALKERTQQNQLKIECLHLGIPSWNIRAESSFLERQLEQLKPDLVLHLVVPNDIEDSSGVRGLGVPSNFSTQKRERTDVMVGMAYPRRILGSAHTGYLRLGLDHESRNRYEEAVQDMIQLKEAVESSGAHYRVLFHYGTLLPLARKFMGQHLEPNALYVAKELRRGDFKLDKTDPHWSPKGHKMMARAVYGLLVQENLLPALSLATWEEAEDASQVVFEEGMKQASDELTGIEVLKLINAPPISPKINFHQMDDATAAQVNTGVDKEGLLSPYASILLKNPAARFLKLRIRCLPDKRLAGELMRVRVDGQTIGTIKLQADKTISETFPLNKATMDRPYLTIVLEADDYVYRGRSLDHCVFVQIESLSLSTAEEP